MRAINTATIGHMRHQPFSVMIPRGSRLLGVFPHYGSISISYTSDIMAASIPIETYVLADGDSVPEGYLYLGSCHDERLGGTIHLFYTVQSGEQVFMEPVLNYRAVAPNTFTNG